MMVGISFVLGFIYLLFLRLCGAVMIFISMTIPLILLAVGGFLCWNEKDKYVDDQSKMDALKIGAYVLWALCGLYLLIMICMYSRIKLAISIFNTTSSFIGQVKSVFFVPLIISVVIIVWMAVWLVTAAFIFSIGTIGPR